jgi:archaeal flagellar protein FlaJ
MFEPTPTAAAAKAGAATKSKKGSRSSPLESFRTFSYGMFGEQFDRGEGDPLLAERLKQAGYDVSPGMYRSVMITTTLVAVAVTFVIGLVLFRFLLHPPFWYGYVGLVVGVTAAAVVLGFGFLVTERIANRKDELDRELPFSLSELSVLASTGTSPIQLVRRMAARDHDLAMTREFKQVVYKMDLEGDDLITALAETGKQSASSQVREAFWDLANMIHQGGSLDEYLRNRADDVLKLKRVIQKQFIERLSAFLDMYVSLVLVGVLLIAVGAFILNTLGQTVEGLDANELLLILTFGMVPLAVVMTVIMISIAYARAE